MYFLVNSVVWYKFDNTGSLRTAKDYSGGTADIGGNFLKQISVKLRSFLGNQATFPSYITVN